MTAKQEKTPVEETKGAEAPDFQLRAETFLKEYGELVIKHKIDIAAYPVYMPDEAGAFKTVIQQSTVDVTDKPYRSPFVAPE